MRIAVILTSYLHMCPVLILLIFESPLFNLIEAANKHFIWNEEIRLKEDIMIDITFMQRKGLGFFCFLRKTKSEK